MPDQTSIDTVSDYREFGEPLSDYIRRIEKVEARSPEILRRGIISSHDLDIPPLTRGDVEKRQIAWRLYEYTIFYINTVKAGTNIERHSHGEDVFRLMMQGSLVLNREMKFKTGDWFVVRAGQPYEIKTDGGYVAMCGYAKACLSPRLEQ